jgi:hypothetical protein
LIISDDIGGLNIKDVFSMYNVLDDVNVGFTPAKGVNVRFVPSVKKQYDKYFYPVALEDRDFELGFKADKGVNVDFTCEWGIAWCRPETLIGCSPLKFTPDFEARFIPDIASNKTVKEPTVDKSTRITELLVDLGKKHEALEEVCQVMRKESTEEKMQLNRDTAIKLLEIKGNTDYDEDFEKTLAKVYFKGLNPGVITNAIDKATASELVNSYAEHCRNFYTLCHRQSRYWVRHDWFDKLFHQFFCLSESLFIRKTSQYLQIVETYFGKTFKFKIGKYTQLVKEGYTLKVDYECWDDEFKLYMVKDNASVILYEHGECKHPSFSVWGYSNKAKGYKTLQLNDETGKNGVCKSHIYIHDLILLLTYGVDFMDLITGDNSLFVVDHVDGDASHNGVFTNLAILTRASNSSKGHYEGIDTSELSEERKLEIELKKLDYFDFSVFFEPVTYIYYCGE